MVVSSHLRPCGVSVALPEAEKEVMSILVTRTRGVHRTITIAALIVILLCSFAAQAQADQGKATTRGLTTLYVSPKGSDSDTGSVRAPLKSAHVAIARLGAAGGTVVFDGGRYVGQRITIANRSHITLKAARGQTPVLDGKGITPPDGSSGMIEIRDSTDITVQGLTVTGYRTESIDKMPIGIYVTGSGSGIALRGNHVHHLGNDNGTLGSYDINAHGIAIYGRNAKTSISDVHVVGNELDHLVLGASESLVVNGNVDGWWITDNNIHDNNNIGIDAIGFEPTISGAARFTDVNRARNGVIARNTVSRIISEGNPSYYEDGEWCNCADGIYVDGGLSIEITKNRVEASDIGIEVASEWAKGSTNDISVTGNRVTQSRYTGVAIGGYDQDRGEAYDITVEGNFLRDNNTLDDGSPEMLVQYDVHDTTITNNVIESTKKTEPLMLFRNEPAGSAAQNAGVVLDNNRYVGRVAPGEETYGWNGVAVQGLTAYQAVSGQDASSTYKRTKR